MITLRKLQSLRKDTRLRKIIRIMAEVERGWACNLHIAIDLDYLGQIGGLVAAEAEISDTARCAGARLTEVCTTCKAQASGRGASSELVRCINNLRHALSAFVGREAAEWDLIIPTRETQNCSHSLPVTLFLEDLRSPFNVGSIIRTAAAFGISRVILSPDTASADHPRAQRSAMGAARFVPLERMELTAVAEGAVHLLALEQGGCPINEFRFPDEGTVVIGSEELGVSPAALLLADRDQGRVSIPLPGPKASLNVGVAVGILLAAWQSSLTQR